MIPTPPPLFPLPAYLKTISAGFAVLCAVVKLLDQIRQRCVQNFPTLKFMVIKKT